MKDESAPAPAEWLPRLVEHALDMIVVLDDSGRIRIGGIEAGHSTAGPGARNLTRLLEREPRAAERRLPLPLAVAR